MDERWEVVRSIAEDQHGAFTSRQVRGLGIDSGWLTRAERDRRIGRFFRGAYGIAGMLDEWSVVAAAQLVSSRAVAGYTAAAKLHRFDGLATFKSELLVPPNVKVRGLECHHTTDLVVPEIVIVDGIRCTDEIRTLVDVAAVLDAESVERAVESYRRRSHADVAALRDRAGALARPGRSGPRQLLSVLDALPAVATESDLETVYWQVLRRYGVALPDRQVAVGPFRLDQAWSDIKLFAELDGYSTHSDRTAFGRDRQRQNWLVGEGWTPLRFTDSDVRNHGRRTAWITEREVTRRRAASHVA